MNRLRNPPRGQHIWPRSRQRRQPLREAAAAPGLTPLRCAGAGPAPPLRPPHAGSQPVQFRHRPTATVSAGPRRAPPDISPRLPGSGTAERGRGADWRPPLRFSVPCVRRPHRSRVASAVPSRSGETTRAPLTHPAALAHRHGAPAAEVPRRREARREL